MIKRIFLTAAAGLFFSLAGFDITPRTMIFKEDFKDQPELKAVESFRIHLRKIFGRKINIRPLNSVKNPVNSVILRSDPKLGAEEWLIRLEGKNLIISGGYPRGVYYAVHRFLENFADVRWFTPFETRIIKKSRIHFPDKTVLRGQPAFCNGRTIVPGYKTLVSAIFHTRHGVSGHYGKWPSNFSLRSIGGNCHTFYQLTKDIPKDKEHLLPVTANNLRQKALSGHGPGQICFSNREFRVYAKEKIREMIKKHQEYFVKYPNIHRPSWNRIIELSQNDNNSFCRCRGCIALEKKYGALSGAMLDFVNDIAGAFPEYTIQTFAYALTAKPPKGIKARENVMIRFAFLAGDILRPLSSETNKEFRQYYEDWNKICKKKSIWSYHRAFRMTESFPWPQSCYWYIAEDLRYYRKIGAEKLFDENELLSARAFYDLHVYLVAALSLDPDRDEKKLIDEFFDFQYGPAAPEMKEYAAYLKKRLDAVPGKLNGTPLKARSCFDETFFRTVNCILDRAEQKAKGNKQILKLIALERVPVDYAAAYMWEPYGKAVLGDLKKLCDRLEKNAKMLFKRYLANRKGKYTQPAVKFMVEQQLKVIKMLREPLPTPPGMEKLDIRQISVMENDHRRNVPDPDAAYGTAYKFSKVSKRFPHKPEYVSFVCYDHTVKKTIASRKIAPSEQKQDEKYHLYYIGRWAPDGFHNEHLRGHRSWTISLVSMYKKVWDATDPDREYDFYISMKLTGPAYVKGSKKDNAIYIDKLVVVKRGERKHQ